MFELLTKISALSEPDQEAALDAASEDPAIVEQVRAALHAECESETVSSQAGRVLGHYTVGAELGRGAMGQVYQARDQELDRHVAIKFLPPEVLGKDAVVNRFVHEAKASSLLNHPNIVTIHQFIREADTLAIVMERIDGQTLRSLIQSQTISCAQALGYAQQIAEGLGAAHAHGIIHRDIKPENIMIRSDGYVKILDFGLAGLTLEADSPRTYTPSGLTSLGGTPRYMSPEQERRESLTPASDIYSFGLVLKEMAPPFGPLKTLVNLMLDPNAARRPSASAVAGRLQLLRKSRRPWLRFVVAAILICSVTAWYFWNRRTAATNSIGLRQLTMQITENRVTASAISPDGKQLAYATVDGIFLQAVATGESRLLQAPKDFWVDRIRWFAGGDRLLAGGFSRSSQHAAIWTVSASGQVPVLFREDSRDPQPSHDGTQVAFTDGGRTALWSAGPAGENPRRILSIESDHLAILYWSADASHVAFNRISTPIQMDPTAVLSRFGNVSGMMGVYESVDLRTGQIDVRYQGEVPLSAAVLRPGSVIFLSPEPTNRQAGNCLWQMQIDPRTAGPLGKPVRLPMKAEWVHDLSAAADGHTVSLIRVTSLPTIHVGDFSPEVPAIRNVRRLTLDASHSFPHSWTADSRAVIFESDRRGNNDLFRQDIDSRVAESIVGTAGEDFHASLTPEGNRVLFMQGSIGSLLPAAIMRAPLAGGGAEEVIKRGVVDEFRCAFPGGSGCIARTNHEGQTYNFYQLDATRGLGREVARTKWLPNIYGDWALSPHGTEVAIPNHDRKSAVIRLISLDQGTERELVLPGIVSLSGLNWTADGKGWFVCITTSVGGQIVYADRRGRIKSLLDVGSYVVPSPDGRHVAIMIPSVTTNVWTVEGL